MDAYKKLGLSKTDDDQTIKRAYLNALREVSPEKDPERFEEIRAAYELIQDKFKRAQYELFYMPEIQQTDILESIIPKHRLQKPSVEWLISNIAESIKKYHE